MVIHSGVGSLDWRLLRKVGEPCEKSLKKIGKSTVTDVRSTANGFERSWSLMSIQDLLFMYVRILTQQ